MPGHNPQLDNPSWNILQSDDNMDIEAVVGKTEDNGWLDQDTLTIAEAEVDTKLDTEACAPSSTEVIRMSLRNNHS